MVRAELEPVTSGFQVRRPNHSATLPPQKENYCYFYSLHYNLQYHFYFVLHQAWGLPIVIRREVRQKGREFLETFIANLSRKQM